MLSDILGVAGLGMSIYGGLSGASVAHQEANVSMDEASLENQQNSVRQQGAALNAQRASLETIRNTQKARSMSLAASTASGSQFGSGIQGALASDTDQGALGLRNINQNMQLSNQLFNLTGKIGQDKIQMAQLGGEAATDAGWASLGGAVMKSAPTVGNIFKGLTS